MLPVRKEEPAMTMRGRARFNRFSRFNGRRTTRGLGALLAAEFVDRCGVGAIEALAERRDRALGQGDDPGAEGWRHVLSAAEAILADAGRRT
jgi:hypothetical protein